MQVDKAVHRTGIDFLFDIRLDHWLRQVLFPNSRCTGNGQRYFYLKIIILEISNFQMYIMATYYVAQVGIAVSAAEPRPAGDKKRV
jgi:hypothetical protein